MHASSGPVRRFLRLLLGVRALLLLVLLASVWLGWIAHRARVQRRAAAAIMGAGGEVSYENQFRRISTTAGHFRLRAAPNEHPMISRWLVKTFGIDYVSTVWRAQIKDTVDDDLLASIGQLSDLEELEVIGGSGTNAGLTHLRRLTKLYSLRIERGDASYSGAGLSELRQLMGLRKLELRDIPLADTDIVFLPKMTELRDLQIYGQGVRLTDAAMAYLPSLTRLETLILNTTEVSDRGMTYINGLTRLECLRLGSTRVTTQGIRSLGGAHGLIDLWISESLIDDLSPIRHLAELRLLSLGRCPIDDSGLASVTSFKSLETLYLYRTRVTGAGISRLQGLPKLVALQLSGAPITDAVLTDIATLSIHSLFLSDTQVTDAGLVTLRRIPVLNRLSLARTPISDNGLAELARFPFLVELDLSNTNISDAGLAHLANAAQGVSSCRVVLSGTAVTDAGLRVLRTARPKWQVIREESGGK